LDLNQPLPNFHTATCTYCLTLTTRSPVSHGSGRVPVCVAPTTARGPRGQHRTAAGVRLLGQGYGASSRPPRKRYFKQGTSTSLHTTRSHATTSTYKVQIPPSSSYARRIGPYDSRSVATAQPRSGPMPPRRRYSRSLLCRRSCA
jgi:hypothetical protein